MNLGTTELLIIVVLVVVIFGAGWLPKAARNLGRAKVEIDRTQKQLTETKQQVIEATGLEKAEETMRKANRALNQSPKNLVKGAAAGALTPKKPATDEVPPPADVDDTVAQEPKTEDEDETTPVINSETINLDLSD